MKSSEQNYENSDTPYECNFILVPREEAAPLPADVTQLNIAQNCFPLQKTIQ